MVAFKDLWYRHWIEEGLAALEEMARPKAGAFLFGDAPTIADICLVPQLYNDLVAQRFGQVCVQSAGIHDLLDSR